jgi:peroxiredoxin
MKSLALIAVASACVLFSCSGPSHPAGAAAQKVSSNRKPAPDFTLKDADGKDVKLSEYRGKVVLLNFWATWCGPCQLEIPWFIDFEKQYKSQGLEVIGVSMDDEGWPVIKPFVASHKMNYRVLLGNDSVTQLYGGIDALPTTFLIDRQGRIAKAHVGLAGRNEYLDEIKSLLGS